MSTNLLNLQNFLSDVHSNQSNVDVIYTNFTKAFGKMNNQILFAKLNRLIFIALFCLDLFLLLKIIIKLWLIKHIGLFQYLLHQEFLKGPN